MDKLWCFCRDGALYCTNYAAVYDMPTNKKVASILEINNGFAKIKYEDGSIDAIEIKSDRRSKVGLYPEIYGIPDQDYKVEILNGIIHIAEYYLTSAFAQTVLRVEFVGGKYDIKFWFKDGSKELFTPQVRAGQMGIVSAKGDFYFMEDETKLYSVYGEMTEIDPEGAVMSGTEYMQVLQTKTGERFQFYRFVGVPRRLAYYNNIAVYINGKKLATGHKLSPNSNFTYSGSGGMWDIHPQLGMPHVINTGNIVKFPNTVKIVQNSGNIILTNKDGKTLEISSSYDRSRYVRLKPDAEWDAANSDYIFVSNSSYMHVDKGPIKKYGPHFIGGQGQAYTVNKFKHPYPLEFAFLKKIFSIRKYLNTFIINNRHVIVSIPDLKNIEAGDDHDLIITTRDGVHRGRINEFEGLYIILDDKVKFPIIPIGGPYYSEFGEYSETINYEKVANNVYIINGDYVFFEAAEPTFRIYESFGQYICVMPNRICVGIITINRQSKPIKPAIRAIEF